MWASFPISMSLIDPAPSRTLISWKPDSPLFCPFLLPKSPPSPCVSPPISSGISPCFIRLVFTLKLWLHKLWHPGLQSSRALVTWQQNIWATDSSWFSLHPHGLAHLGTAWRSVTESRCRDSFRLVSWNHQAFVYMGKAFLIREQLVVVRDLSVAPTIN